MYIIIVIMVHHCGICFKIIQIGLLERGANVLDGYEIFLFRLIAFVCHIYMEVTA